jgi:hypothetical protein
VRCATSRGEAFQVAFHFSLAYFSNQFIKQLNEDKNLARNHMKKIVIILVLSILFAVLYATEYTLEQRIDRYSGINAMGLKQMLKTTAPDTLKYVQFLLENASPFDLAVLTPDFILTNIRLALETKELPYTKEIPEELFLHFVFPPRISQEPFENWRPIFYKELLPIVQNCKSLEEAAFLVNLWTAEKMAFKPTNGRDQAPLTTIKRGYGRCEECMIIYMAAARAAGIPCRPASVPYWNFTDNNHAWTDVWTTSGWKFIGAAEAANRLGETWFAETTTRATLVNSEAYGDFESPQKVKFENGVTVLATTGDYAKTVKVTVSVVNEKGKPLIDARVMLYGASYGGEMPMMSLKTDASGIVKFPLGKGGVWITAYGDSLFGSSMLNTMNGDVNLMIICSKNQILNEKFNIHFPLPSGRAGESYGTPIINDFEHLCELSNLRRENRINSYKHPTDFLAFYDVQPKEGETDSTFTERREHYLSQCDQLAGNADVYRKVFKANKKMSNAEDRCDLLCKMIEEWDVKELVELPDSSAIQTIVDLYLPSKLAYPDSLWRENILKYTFSTPPCPENGWEAVLYEKVKDLKGNDNDETVNNLVKWVDSQLIIDDDITYTYFSGSITPLDFLNMKNVTPSGRIIMLASTLKLLQVPIRWKGFLEYYDGREFIPIEEQKEKKEPVARKTRTLTVSVYVDGKKVKASAYENFFLAAMTEKGTVDDTYFDTKDKDLDCVVTFPEESEVSYYLEGMTRNSNGDAQVSIKSVKSKQDVYKIELNTPKDYFDVSAKWSNKTRKEMIHHAQKWAVSGGSKLLFIRASETSEPQQRMLAEMLGKKKEFAEKNCELVIYTENRNNDDIKDTEGLQLRTGIPIINEKLNIVDYPVLFLIGADNQILYSSRGYQMGMGSLLLKKIR